MKTPHVAILMACAVSILAACAPDSVPAVGDPDNIVIDGQKLTKLEFMNKYCQGKTNHETCDKVAQAIGKDASRRKEAVRF